nr:NAD-dependent epimerase/dehydratase family protein [Longispora sp. (in: high G+C Gram-positive bacteria)]
MSNKTIFVTGGAGFIGLHVIPLLLEQGHRVRIFDNMSRGDRTRVNEFVASGNVDVVE